VLKFLIACTFVIIIIENVLHSCKYNTNHFLIPDDDDDDDDDALYRNRENAMLAKKDGRVRQILLTKCLVLTLPTIMIPVSLVVCVLMDKGKAVT
jgi:hypothetical protein